MLLGVVVFHGIFVEVPLRTQVDVVVRSSFPVTVFFFEILLQVFQSPFISLKDYLFRKRNL